MFCCKYEPFLLALALVESIPFLGYDLAVGRKIWWKCYASKDSSPKQKWFFCELMLLLPAFLCQYLSQSDCSLVMKSLWDTGVPEKEHVSIIKSYFPVIGREVMRSTKLSVHFETHSSVTELVLQNSMEKLFSCSVALRPECLNNIFLFSCLEKK